MTNLCIYFEGSEFSPLGLKSNYNFDKLIVIREKGELVKTGIFKGKYSPYGMGYVIFKNTTSSNSSFIFEEALKFCFENKETLIKNNITNLNFVIDESIDKSLSFKLNTSLLNSLSEFKIDFELNINSIKKRQVIFEPEPNIGNYKGKIKRKPFDEVVEDITKQLVGAKKLISGVKVSTVIHSKSKRAVRDKRVQKNTKGKEKSIKKRH